MIQEFFAPETVLNSTQRGSLAQVEYTPVGFQLKTLLVKEIIDVVEDQKAEMRQNLTELEGSVQATGDDGFANRGTTIDSVE
ncbi:unnamed protein product [Prunus brigantina]